MAKGLGKGLSALITENQYSTPNAGRNSGGGDSVSDISNASQKTLPLDRLAPGQFQPRSNFNEEELHDLAESIRRNGVVQPVIVRKGEGDKYEIIAGERRWRASKIAGLIDVPVVIREFSNSEALEVALIENIQRQDLNPLEIAEGYKRLVDEFNYTQEVLAEAVGKSRSMVTNQLRLLGLPDEVKALVNSNTLSYGHARALLGSNDPVGLADAVVKRGLNVRQTERLVQQNAKNPELRKKSPNMKDPDIIALEKSVSQNIGMDVLISPKGEKGVVTISYKSMGELSALLQKLESGGTSAEVVAEEKAAELA